MDLCEFKASVVYMVRSMTAGAIGSRCLSIPPIKAKKKKIKQGMLRQGFEIIFTSLFCYIHLLFILQRDVIMYL